ncbi:response regulator transcription factor [Chitinophaga sp. MM2321]|uniref:response regulator transcription factor n=1 Tax=Chitinophaga sp. MM2321 TaxID=3137178 RepID=UPI0032D57E73
MKKILIADDHAIIRLGLAKIIASLPVSTSVTEAETLDEAITSLGQQKFDLLILDINLPGGNNLHMISAVKLRQPDIRVLIFSAYAEQLYAINYLQAGADGYIEKNAGNEEIKAAIITTLRQEKYMSATTRENMLHKLNLPGNNERNPIASLSPRETEVLHLLGKGFPIARIATLLQLHITTVSTYKTRIFDKLEVTNIVDLLKKMEIYSPPI